MITYHYFPRDYFVQMCKLLSCFHHSGPEILILDPVNQITEESAMLEAMKNAQLGHFMSHFNDLLSLLVQLIMQSVCNAEESKRNLA